MSDQAISRRIAGAYDQIAAEFAVRNAAMPHELLELGARFLALTGPHARVLDVGCGSGRDMAWLEERGVVVTGIDLSSGMLAQARPRVAGALARMDMRHLALASGCFAGAWCMASLLHVPKAEAPGVLRELHRVLLPGGVLAVGLKEGAGEGWERGPYGTVEQFFARYAPEEAETLLATTGFLVQRRAHNAAGARRWLQFLARVPGTKSPA